jgi:hypothetical protein
MWIMTTKGYFSITVSPVEPDKVQVRSRRKSDLVSLLPSSNVLTTTESDYPFRVILTRDQLRELMANLADELSYQNFKNEVRRLKPKDSVYLSFLHGVWERWWNECNMRRKR